MTEFIGKLVDDLLVGFERQADRLVEDQHKQSVVRQIQAAVPHLGEMLGPALQQTDAESMLSVKEVAEIFGVSPSTVSAWITAADWTPLRRAARQVPAALAIESLRQR